jgi:hypothetical protein
MITKNNFIKIFLILSALIGVFVFLPDTSRAYWQCGIDMPPDCFRCIPDSDPLAYEVPPQDLCSAGYCPAGQVHGEITYVPNSGLSGDYAGFNQYTCSNNSYYDCTPSKSLSVSPSRKTINVGDETNFSANLHIVFRDCGELDTDVTASSTFYFYPYNPGGIAQNNGSGSFTGLSAGQVEIAAEYNNVRSPDSQGDAILTVKGVAVSTSTLKLDAAIVDSSCNPVNGGSLSSNGISNSEVTVTVNNKSYNPGSYAVASGTYSVSSATISNTKYQPINCPTNNTTNYYPSSLDLSAANSSGTITSYFTPSTGSNSDTVPVQFIVCSKTDSRSECVNTVVNSCGISASKSNVLSGERATLYVDCNLSSRCTVTDNDKYSWTVQVPDYGRVSTSTYQLVNKTNTFNLSCTNNQGVVTLDPDSVTITAGYLPVIREIIPR